MNILKTIVFLNNFMTYFISRASDPIYYNTPRPKPTKKAYLMNNKWYIDINTREDLENLIKEEGTIIISKEAIQIYDDWIE